MTKKYVIKVGQGYIREDNSLGPREEARVWEDWRTLADFLEQQNVRDYAVEETNELDNLLTEIIKKSKVYEREGKAIHYNVPAGLFERLKGAVT